MKLQYKITLLIFAILLVVGLIGATVLIYLHRQNTVTHFEKSVLAVAAVLQDSLKDDMLQARREHVQEEVVSIASGNLFNEVMILSVAQKVYASNEVSEVGQIKNNQDIAQALATGEIVTRIEKKNGRTEFSIIQPIMSEPACMGCHGSVAKILGVIEIGMDRTSLDAQTREQTALLALIGGVTFVAVGVMLTVTLRSAVVHPLSKLSASARRIAEGNFSARVDVAGKDEIGMVAHTFNEMAEQIEQHAKSLEVSKKELEGIVQERTKQLQDLSFHLESVREEERTSLSREIHDELGQLLTGLKMDISWMSKNILKGDTAFATKAAEMDNLIDEALERVKSVSTRLRPAVLDHIGISAAIEWQTEELAKHVEMSFEFKPTPKDITLDPGRSIEIFRICQEALTNVIRHANATKVNISLKKDRHHIILRVQDNGKGIDELQTSEHKTFGIIGMKERARHWGGEVTIKGTPGKGTLVSVSIPLDGQEGIL